MHTTQNTGDEGVARPTPTDPAWYGCSSGVQTTDGDSLPLAEACAGLAQANELPSRSGLFIEPVQADLDGFAAPVWNPKPYQERGVEWLVTRPEAGLFLPPGMGKTSIALAAQAKLKEMGRPNRMLVLAPLTVCLTTWMSEPIKWRQFQSLKIGLAHGPDKELILNDPYYDIVVLNYDGLAWAVPMLLQGHAFDILVCDELTRLKNHAAKRFKVIKPLLPSFTFRWGLTGTPASNGMPDLFGQAFVLDLGKRLGRFITHFRMKYLYQELWDQYRYYIKPEKAELLVKNISDMCMYLDPKDHLQLPGLVDIPLSVSLPPALRSQYLGLEHDFIIKLKDGVVTAANAGVLTSKLRQFTGGGMYVTDDIGVRTAVHIHDVKLDRLEQLVDEMAGEPLLVAYQFNHELERLQARFPEALAIKGGMRRADLQSIVTTWNSGQHRLLFVQPTAAALGLNLQFGGSAICWFSMTYNLEEFIQLIARLYRQGQKDVVRNYMLLMDKTIDGVIAKLMVTKDATQNMVFEGLKEYSNME